MTTSMLRQNNPTSSASSQFPMTNRRGSGIGASANPVNGYLSNNDLESDGHKQNMATSSSSMPGHSSSISPSTSYHYPLPSQTLPNQVINPTHTKISPNVGGDMSVPIRSASGLSYPQSQYDSSSYNPSFSSGYQKPPNLNYYESASQNIGTENPSGYGGSSSHQPIYNPNLNLASASYMKHPHSNIPSSAMSQHPFPSSPVRGVGVPVSQAMPGPGSASFGHPTSPGYHHGAIERGPSGPSASSFLGAASQLTASDAFANNALGYIGQQMLSKNEDWLNRWSYWPILKLRPYFQHWQRIQAAGSNSGPQAMAMPGYIPVFNPNDPSGTESNMTSISVFYALPKEDMNAPDLYIPSMAFVSYVVLVGIITGMDGKFHPEILGVTASSAFVFSFIELIVIKLGTYLLAFGNDIPLMDIVAYVGYKYVGLDLILLAGVLYPYAGALIMWIYTGFAFALFLLRSLKHAFLPEVGSTGYYGNHGGETRKKRIYFLLIIALLQMAFTYFLIVQPSSSTSGPAVSNVDRLWSSSPLGTWTEKKDPSMNGFENGGPSSWQRPLRGGIDTKGPGLPPIVN